jgi:hypothetical protein
MSAIDTGSTITHEELQAALRRLLRSEKHLEAARRDVDEAARILYGRAVSWREPSRAC